MNRPLAATFVASAPKHRADVPVDSCWCDCGLAPVRWYRRIFTPRHRADGPARESA